MILTKHDLVPTNRTDFELLTDIQNINMLV